MSSTESAGGDDAGPHADGSAAEGASTAVGGSEGAPDAGGGVHVHVNLSVTAATVSASANASSVSPVPLSVGLERIFAEYNPSAEDEKFSKTHRWVQLFDGIDVVTLGQS